jgi:nucleotide-binding universal stress UspA family protein
MELNSILIATDFSDCSGSAFKAAQSLGTPFDAKLILLHVIDRAFLDKLARHLSAKTADLEQQLRRQAEKDLNLFQEKWKSAELEIDTIVAVGIPFQEVAVLARDLAVDLVVMGGYGKKGREEIEQVFFGSTAEKVVRLLPCPILCVPL